MSPCDEALDLISARLDGALSPGEEAALEAHLAACPACRALLADLEELHGALPELWTEPPADLRDRVMDRIRSEPPPARRPRQLWKRWLPMAAVFAVILLGAGGLRWLGAGHLGAGSSGGAAAPAAGEPAAPAGDQMDTASCSGGTTPETMPDAPADAPPELDAGDGTAAPMCAPVPASAPAGRAAAVVTAKNPDGSRIAEAGNSADTEDTRAAAAFALLGAEPELAGLVPAGPLPGQEETGLLLRRAEGAPEDTPAYAALLCMDADGTEIHLHTCASAEGAAWDGGYTIWTLVRGPDGVEEIQSEKAEGCALCPFPPDLAQESPALSP